MSRNSTTEPRTVVVIPARYASTRLPQKMLLRDTGKPLLQYTYEAAIAARRPDAVVIATDHLEIAEVAKRFGAKVVMTSPDCTSGTDRVADAARQMPDAEILVNVQGDEPEISPTSIDAVIDLIEAESDGRDGDAGDADSASRSTEQFGVCEGRLGRGGAGALFQPQPDSVYSRCGDAMGRSVAAIQ